MSNIFPSHNPTNSGHLSGTLNVVLRKEKQRTDNQLPAQVLSYDRAKNVATVKPLITIIATDGSILKRAQIASVPVLSLGGGNFCINFPLQKGDLGWIQASDRDISQFMQSLTEAKPNTYRLHSFEDALFIPDAFRKYTFSAGDADAMVIQSYNGAVKLVLHPTSINIIASSSVNVTAPAVTATTTSITTTGSTVHVTAPSITLTGTTYIDGDIDI